MDRKTGYVQGTPMMDVLSRLVNHCSRSDRQGAAGKENKHGCNDEQTDMRTNKHRCTDVHGRLSDSQPESNT